MSRTARVARGTIEACWLLALIVAPLYFNVQSERVFEPDKISLIRWLAIIAGGAWVVWVLETGWSPREGAESWRTVWRRLRDLPFALPALLVVLSYFISTLLSVAPNTSLWGSYQRLQGLWTTYSYIVLFFVTYQHLRTRAQLDRLVTVVIATSVPIGLYGIVQRFGGDPLPWGGDVQTRIAGHLGNAIFLGAYLIMAMFLTLYRVIRSFANILRDTEGTRGYTESLVGGVYLFVFIVQVMALIYTQSRGPFLGFLGGLYIFGLLAILALRPRHYRLLAGGWVGAAVAAGLFLVLFNLPNTPLAPLREMPYIGRLGRILDVSRENPTGRVRVLIWQGAVELLLPHEPLNFPPDMRPDRFNVLRPLIGYGPEAMWVAYNRFYQPELAQIERRNASPDRSHNETFDSLIRTGILGFAAYVWLFVAVFFYSLRWLGLIQTSRDRFWFFALWFGIGFLSVLIARWVDGTWRFFGVALPFGFIIGLIAYVTLIGLTRPLPDVPAAERERYVVLLALLATIAAHYVEVTFGIAIVSTRTYFWILTAVLAIVGTQRLERVVPLSAPASSGSERRSKRRKRRATTVPESSPAFWQDRTLWVYALVAAFILATLAFEFTINLPTGNFITDDPWQIIGNSLFTRVERGLRVDNPYQFYMILFTWVVLALLSVGERVRGWWQRDVQTWAQGLVLVTLAMGIGFLVMALVQARFLATAARLQVEAGRSAAAVVALAEHMGRFPVAYYGLLVFTVMAIALVLGWPAREEFVPWVQRGVSGVLAPVVLAVILWVGFGPALAPIRADIMFKQAKAFSNARRYPEAEAIYQRVLELVPQEDYYYLFYGKTLLDHAQSVTNPEERQQLLDQAEAVLLRARDLNPLNTDHTANLARFYFARAGMSSDPAERQMFLEEALEYFAQAISLSPNNARLRDEYAIALFQVGRAEEALEQLQISLELDDTFYLTYLYLADYYRLQEAWEQAVIYYQEALKRQPNDVRILSGLAFTYARLGDVENAIRYNLQVLQQRPQDFATLRNLAILYREQGNVVEALRYAQRALTVAPPNEQEPIRALVQQLQQESRGQP